MTQLFSNNASTTLSAGINDTVTTIPVTDGSKFQSPSGSDYELLTITDNTLWEVVKVTSRSTNTLTVIRGFEGTAQSWSSGTKIEGRITKETLNKLIQNNGTGTNSIAVGTNASANSLVSIAIGNGATANATQAQASGDNASAAAYSTAIGSNAVASGQGAIAMGYLAAASGGSSVSLGDSSGASSINSVAVGVRAKAKQANIWQANTFYHLGNVVKRTTTDDVFVCVNAGTSGNSQPTWNTAQGDKTTDGTVTWLWAGIETLFNNAVSVGVESSSLGQYSVNVGSQSAAGLSSVAVGVGSISPYFFSVAVGPQSRCNISDGVALGEWAEVSPGSGYGSIAIGPYSLADGTKSQAIAFGADSVNRIGDSYVITGLPLIRKDNGENVSNEHLFFTGSQAIVLSKEVDLKTLADDIATITIPPGSTFFPDEIGLIVTSASGITNQPNISFGITGNTVSLLASTPTTKSVAKGRDIFTPISKDGVNSLTASVKTAAVGTTLLGRFYWKGILVEDE